MEVTIPVSQEGKLKLRKGTCPPEEVLGLDRTLPDSHTVLWQLYHMLWSPNSDSEPHFTATC